MDKLEPCPFCGYEIEFLECAFSPTIWRSKFRCLYCDVEILFKGAADKNRKDIINDIVKIWNTRAGEEEKNGEA